MQILPMTQGEFEKFLEISMEDHMRSQILAGYWTEENASKKMDQMRRFVLPDYMDTPGHYFYTLKENENIVGGFWFADQRGLTGHSLFVMDIQIFEEHRRKGYGTQAFNFMENKAREMGAKKISLNVFDHNKPARAMYEKLGYSGKGELMSKKIL